MTAAPTVALAAVLLAGCASPTAVVPPAAVGDHAVVAAVKPRPEPASRAKVRLSIASSSWARGRWYRYSPRVERWAACVARHESLTAGLWRARNPSSTASGAFQWLDSTWRAHAARAGVAHIPDRAYLASPRKQARVLAWAARHGQQQAWYGTGCDGTGGPAW